MGVLSLMNKPAKKNGKRIPRSIYNPCPDEVRVTPHSRVPRSLLLLILPRPSPEGAESQGPFFAFFARRSWSPHDINRSIFTSPFFSFFFFFLNSAAEASPEDSLEGWNTCFVSCVGGHPRAPGTSLEVLPE